ncbi:hypothetical protein D9613_010486 [Agrocybe pediades]|uniref:Uncharacterized protein n=1 Tax=Agrocybe pediades TaxID=84607 RepID=A0A8H4QFV7_9AGAR|nr:hypothetical protein D9613_010486 [Agrocybe pediades]
MSPFPLTLSPYLYTNGLEFSARIRLRSHLHAHTLTLTPSMSSVPGVLDSRQSPDDPTLFHVFNTQIIILATVIAGICYGFLKMLCFNCYSLLLRSKHQYSKRMQYFLLVYVVVLFLLSTGVMVQEIIIMNLASFPPADMGLETYISVLLKLSGIPYTTVPIVCATDGLLAILYQGIPRAGEWALKAALLILALASVALGLMTFVTLNLLPFSATLVNSILSTLLCGRIIYIQRRFSNLLGTTMSRQSPYTRIVLMCIESSALIVVIG